MKIEVISENEIIEKDIDLLVNKADDLIANTIRRIDHELINLYWSIGKLVNDYKKINKLGYGDRVSYMFAEKLSFKYGKGFTRRNINNMCMFNNVFEKWHPGAKFKNVNWSHIRELLKFKDYRRIIFYLNEVENKNLTKLELCECIKSKGFERTVSNQRNGLIKNEVEKTLKDPIILKIENRKRTEKQLEDEIFKNVFEFMKEIGNSVMLYGRQYKIGINGLIHKVDLVFLDYETNTFILIDLKINKVANRDIMQMKLYIEYFSKEKNIKDANVIGLILCETKDLRLIDDNNIYQIKYLNQIPKDKELLKIINENRIVLLKTEKLEI